MYSIKNEYYYVIFCNGGFDDLLLRNVSIACREDLLGPQIWGEEFSILAFGA